MASAELSSLGAPLRRSRRSGHALPRRGSSPPSDRQPFAAQELWARRFTDRERPSELARSPGRACSPTTSRGAPPRSFQLTYSLSAADIGARLRCVGGARWTDRSERRPSATFAGPEYLVGSSPACRPRRVAPLTSPQPAAVADRRRALPRRALGAARRRAAGLDAIALKRGRIALALSCALARRLHGAAHARLGPPRARPREAQPRARGSQLIDLSLSRGEERAVRRAGRAGLPVALRLGVRGGARLLVVGPTVRTLRLSSISDQLLALGAAR